MNKRTALLIMLLISLASATPNPSAVYCADMGYNYVVDYLPEGEIGICQFPDGTYSEAGEFLRGQSGAEMSYCSANNLGQYLANETRCPGFYGGSCLICKLPDGIEEEASVLASQNPRISFTEYSDKVTDEGSLIEAPKISPKNKAEKNNQAIVIILAALFLVILAVLFTKRPPSKR
jgi:putative hemolysin